LRILEVVAGVAVRLGAQASAILAAVWHPRVVEKTIEMALTDGGTVDRNTLHRATGFTPLPKGPTTIVNVQQNAQGQPLGVPAPCPEDTIRRMAELFNEAPQTLPAPPVRDVVKVTSEEYDADDDNARRDPWG
jgi:hypothetical protein